MVFPIGMLEPNDAVNPVIDAMSNGESGTTNFTTAHYYANGDPYREGVSAVHVNSFFSYQQVRIIENFILVCYSTLSCQYWRVVGWLYVLSNYIILNAQKFPTYTSCPVLINYH